MARPQKLRPKRKATVYVLAIAPIENHYFKSKDEKYSWHINAMPGDIRSADPEHAQALYGLRLATPSPGNPGPIERSKTSRRRR